MLDRIKDAQSTIDEIFEQTGKANNTPASERILKLAERGIDAPEVLSHKEIQQICYALAILYAQMGIG